jgi:trans-aconitate 2-methyltransferase
MRWDPAQYARFSSERDRPFYDLVARVAATAPARVVDLGCGSGELTASLAERWPTAAITGIDSSPEMIERTAASAGDRVAFELGTAEGFTADGLDVLLSNALLQWVPGHRELLRRWAGELNPGGWLAFQVPANFDQPSHRLMREVTAEPRWRDQLAGVLRHGDAVDTAAGYLRLLSEAGLRADVWQTSYLHLLSGTDPVLEWVRGTGLRPVLAALTEQDAAEFCAEYGGRLRQAYPATEFGTVLPFQRIFAVAVKP